MAIPAGKRLGPYEILSQIGAGGMGEVYKARDTRLDRMVAIKVLPAHLADRPELRERFEREARTIANLNHPHTCTLHDIGQQDGIHYLCNGVPGRGEFIPAAPERAAAVRAGFWYTPSRLPTRWTKRTGTGPPTGTSSRATSC